MVIVGVTLTVLFGWIFVWLLNIKLSNTGKLALSYLIGIGLQTLLMFYLAVLHIPLNLINVSSIIIFVGIMLFTFGRFFLKREGSIISLKNIRIPEFKKFTRLEKLIFIVFLVISLYVISAGIYWPVVGWDSIALYDFRAKVFAATGFMDDAIARGYFFGYPLMTSMAHAWIYILGGTYPKFLYSLMYLSFGVIFYELLLKWTNKLTSATFTLLVLVAPPIFTHAAFDYTNLPYTIYFFLGSIFLCVWAEEKQRSWLILSSLMMGLSTWVRSTDPFWVVNIVCLLVIILLRKRKFTDLLIYLILFIVIQQSWSIFLTHYAPHVTTGGIASRSLQIIFKELNFERMLETIVFTINNIFPVLLPYIVLVFLSLLNNSQSIKKLIFLYLVVFGNFGLLFLGTYVFSYIYPGWDLIGESLGRMSFVFVPLFLFLSAVNIDLKRILNI